MYTDLVGFTRLGQRDEALSLAVRKEHQALVRPIFSKYGGREVKSLGDGFLVEFPSAVESVRCAVEVQNAVAERNERADDAARIELRIGVHVGDVVGDGEDIVGDAVNVASRIEPLADPGGICVSAQVYDQIRNKVPVSFQALDTPSLKNVETPIGVYRVALQSSLDDSGSVPAPARAVPRLAVLPLANMSPDAKDEFFSDGLTDELISTLSKIPGLEVISRTSVMQYKGRPKQLGEIGRELKVGVILEGSVRKAGNRIRITVQLIEAAHDRHLWAENYDRTLEDIFAIQSEIAEKIAAALQIRLLEDTKKRITTPATRDAWAHTLYLKGRTHFALGTEEGLMTAIGYYQEAIQRDPGFALAYAHMARAHHLLGFFELLPPREAFERSFQLALKAVELDPSLTEGHLTLAEAMRDRGHLADASRETFRALELGPNSAEAHLAAARHYAYAGEPAKAEAECDRALELDPISPDTVELVATWLLYSDRAQRAQELFQSIVDRLPNGAFARGNLGLSQVRQGRYDAGIAELRTAIKLAGRFAPPLRIDLAYALKKAGRVEEARAVVGELLQYHAETGLGSVAVAFGYAILGDRDDAFTWLEKARQDGSGYLQSITTDFALEDLRADPRYGILLKRMGVEENRSMRSEDLGTAPKPSEERSRPN
jgi:adenylate cyclase